jgi:hypothetical protein
VRALDGARQRVAVLEHVVAAGVREGFGGPLADDDLGLLLEHLHPLAQRAEREAEGAVLALVPAGAETELGPPAGDVVDGRRRPAEHRRVPERGR